MRVRCSAARERERGELTAASRAQPRRLCVSAAHSRTRTYCACCLISRSRLHRVADLRVGRCAGHAPPSKRETGAKASETVRQRQRRDARCTATDVYRLRTDSVVWANSPQIQVLDRSNTTRIQVLAKLG